MTPSQCRAARGLVNMSQSQLGFAAVVPLGTIIDFEAEATLLKDDDLDALQDVLERAGVEFIEGERPGVRLRK